MTIRTTNPEVPRFWANGIAARSGNGQFSTNGESLFSYSQLIGRTLNDGTKVLLDYTAPSGHLISVTTSVHVNRAKPHADLVVNPSVVQNLEIFQEPPPF
jgi:hypothetical protein